MNWPADLVDTKEDGRIKLYVTHRSLALPPRPSGALHAPASIIPLAAEGSKAGHLFAFARRAGGRRAVVAVPRLVARLAAEPGRPPICRSVWQDTRLVLPASTRPSAGATSLPARFWLPRNATASPP